MQKIHKKIAPLLFFSLALATSVIAASWANFPAQSAQAVAPPQPAIEALDEVLDDSNLPDFQSRISQQSSVEPGADIITSIIFTVIDFVKYLLGAVAVVYIIISALKLITAGNKIDEMEQKEKDNLKYILYGLVLVIIADELVTKVFFGDYGECLASASNAKECAQLGGGLVKGIYSFVLAVMASLSVFVLVLSAFRIITAYGNEEDITKQKKRIGFAVVGLILAGVAEFVVKGIVFPEGGTKGIDVIAAQKLVFNFTNFIASFIGAAAFAMLFYGGYMYVASFGNEEQTGKAKKIIVGAIIGIVIAFAAFGIVTTLTSFTSGREVNLPQNLPGLPTSPGSGTK